MRARHVPRFARRVIRTILDRWLYARHRQGLAYYDEVVRLARRWAPNARSALDVGPADTVLLSRLDWVGERTAIDLDREPRVPDATNIRGDFLSFEATRPFDLVLCLQVLEHLENPVPFARKLLATGDTVIISVPYLWPQGHCADHRHDPVDETKLARWIGRPCKERSIVTEKNGFRRLVAVFDGTALPGQGT